MQAVNASDVKTRLQKNCAKYRDAFQQRERLDLLLRTAKCENADGLQQRSKHVYNLQTHTQVGVAFEYALLLVQIACHADRHATDSQASLGTLRGCMSEPPEKVAPSLSFDSLPESGCLAA